MSRVFLCSVAVLLSCTAVVWANRAPPPQPTPKPAVSPEAKLAVIIDKNAKISKLIIPKKYVTAALGQVGAAEPAPAQHRTVVAGLALSLAAVSLLLVRRRGRKALVGALAGLCLAGILGGWSVSYADIPAGPPDANIPRVTIQIVDQGDAVTFIKAKDVP